MKAPDRFEKRFGLVRCGSGGYGRPRSRYTVDVFLEGLESTPQHRAAAGGWINIVD